MRLTCCAICVAFVGLTILSRPTVQRLVDSRGVLVSGSPPWTHNEATVNTQPKGIRPVLAAHAMDNSVYSEVKPVQRGGDPLGACCTPFSCDEGLTLDECLAQGGEYLGDGSTCQACTGACCFPSIDGQDNCFGPIDPINCSFSHGIHLGPGSDCDPNECPIFGGACCLSFGGCVIESQEGCEELGATFLGEGVPCPAPEDPCEAPGCQTHEDCDDGSPCTADTCDEFGECQNISIPGCCTSDAQCDDGDVCNGAETCVNNVCEAGTPLDCNDNNPCTDDLCITSGCVNVTIPDCCVTNEECDNGDVCDGAETCVANVCMPGAALICDDGDPCTSDTCDPVLGCQNDPVAGCCRQDADCDDGLFCNGAETCPTPGGSCEAGTPPCDPIDQICDENGDACLTPCTIDEECDDGAFCNGEEFCFEGICSPDVPPCSADEFCDEADDVCKALCNDDSDCDNGLFCDGTEFCNILIGACEDGVVPCFDPTPVCNEELDLCDECANDSECDDFTFCNGEELCIAGSCQEGNAPCPPGQCDELFNTCKCTTDADCDDGLFCNGAEVCVDELCFPLEGSEPCPSDAPCDEIGDRCLCSVQADCDDGIFCNGVENCVDGSCVDGEFPCQPPDDVCIEVIGCTHGCSTDQDCDNGLFCDGMETCSGFPDFTCRDEEDPCGPETAGCDEINDACLTCADDADCDDGQFCNGPEICLLGECLAGISECEIQGLNCNEVTDVCGGPCTSNSDCDDGLFCNGGEACVDGDCVLGEEPCLPLEFCDEITDSCEGTITCGNGICGAPDEDCENCPEDCACLITQQCVQGVCVNCTVDADCSDGDACNGAELCVNGSCATGTPLNCNDNDACTTDGCDPFIGCEYAPVVCNDGDPCTTDICNSATGCVFTPINCNDNDLCTSDACVNGACANTPIVCDDLDACTFDACDPDVGCVNLPINCDDGNVCTFDSCDSATGCITTPNTLPCDDGDACTENDECAGGFCDGTPVNCDDGLYCNGAEICDSALGCQPGVLPCLGQTCNEDNDTCSSVPCDAIEGMKAKCTGNNNLRVVVRLETDEYSGDSITVTVDNVPYVIEIENKRGDLNVADLPAGAHVVALSEPAGCLEPEIVDCP